MPTEGTNPSQRIALSFQKLAASAADLNVASDELGKSISALDASLKRLNLGVSAWQEIDGRVDHATGCYWTDYVGYTKVGDRWGISISHTEGSIGDEPEVNQEWLFNDAPRALRVRAVTKLPELFEQLIKAADEITAKIEQNTAAAREFAAAIAPLLGERKAR